jgi:hypothetical protein
MRVRFEAGKRIPGIAASGVDWAAPRARGLGALWDALGLVVTLGGGALVLVGAARGAAGPGAVVAPRTLAVLVVGAGVMAWLARSASVPRRSPHRGHALSSAGSVGADLTAGRAGGHPALHPRTSCHLGERWRRGPNLPCDGCPLLASAVVGAALVCRAT